MFKLIYAAFLLLFSSAMFLFNKAKPVRICTHELTGIVREMKSQEGITLYIEGQDHKKYFPLIEREDIIIASGGKVNICYDKAQVMPDQTVRIRINDVVYVP